MSKEKPKQVDAQMHNEGVRYAHPAFGKITMSICRGNIGTLFGSDIGHSSAVLIEIETAVVDRTLNRDWIHKDKHVLSFLMSRAQFANFITSSGDGSGTPITFTIFPEGGERVHVPGIEKLESKADVLKRDISKTAEDAIAGLWEEIDELGKMLESGKVGIKDAREIHRVLKAKMENLPKNMEFTVASAERALESATSAAKIEIEGYLESARFWIDKGNAPKLIDDE